MDYFNRVKSPRNNKKPGHTHSNFLIMTYCVYVTEQIVTSYEFDTEEEARNAMDNGDFWDMESELIDGEVLDVELVEQKGY